MPFGVLGLPLTSGGNWGQPWGQLAKPELELPPDADPKRVGALMRAIEGYEGSLTVRCALHLAPLVFVRPGEGIAKDEMSGHGFRAMARTILDEVLGFRPDFIEHQLAHAVRDPNGRAYNRTAHLVERRKMMQAWADYLDKLKNGADVIPILKAG
jgi:hypothetical protein